MIRNKLKISSHLASSQAQCLPWLFYFLSLNSAEGIRNGGCSQSITHFLCCASSSHCSPAPVWASSHSPSGKACCSLDPLQATVLATKSSLALAPLHRPQFQRGACFCMDFPQATTSFRAHSSAAAWGSPWAAMWYLLQHGPAWAASLPNMWLEPVERHRLGKKIHLNM